MMYRPAHVGDILADSAARSAAPEHRNIYHWWFKICSFVISEKYSVLSIANEGIIIPTIPKSSTDFDELACSFVARFVLLGDSSKYRSWQLQEWPFPEVTLFPTSPACR